MLLRRMSVKWTVAFALLCCVTPVSRAEASCPEAAKHSDVRKIVDEAFACVGWPLKALTAETRLELYVPPLAAPETVAIQGFGGAVTIGGSVANELFSLIAEIAVDRAKRDGLAFVQRRLSHLVCSVDFQVPGGGTDYHLDETCALVRATDLQTLVGQARALRTSLTSDILSVAESETVRRLDKAPHLRRSGTLAVSLIRRIVSDPDTRISRDDVWLIADAFINASWTPGKDVDATHAQAFQIAIGAARVYIESLRAGVTNNVQDHIDIAYVISRFVDAACAGQPFCAYRDNPRIARAIGDWTNLAVKTVAAVTADRKQEDYRARLRAAVQLVFEAYEIAAQEPMTKRLATIKAEMLTAFSDPTARAAIENAFAKHENLDDEDSIDPLGSLRADLLGAAVFSSADAQDRLAKALLQQPSIPAWIQTVALAALEGDAPQLLAALADTARAAIGSSCEDDCVDRRKVAGLLSGIATYAISYQEIPSDTPASQLAAMQQQQRDTRKAALESVIDGATDRRGRGQEWIVSLGTAVGFSLGRATIDAVANNKLGSGQLHVPFGVGVQWLPNPFGLHFMATALDLGNYVINPGETGASPDWKAIFSPGIQAGVAIGNPGTFFTVGGTFSYSPHFTTSPATNGTTRSATRFGLFAHYYLPLWDFN